MAECTGIVCDVPLKSMIMGRGRILTLLCFSSSLAISSMLRRYTCVSDSITNSPVCDVYGGWAIVTGCRKVPSIVIFENALGLAAVYWIYSPRLRQSDVGRPITFNIAALQTSTRES
ncbi:hypothetical protein AB1N83_012459 [Pleurotus pulmonarius]